MAFEKVTVFEVPAHINSMVQQQKKEERAAAYIAEDTVYLVVTRGEKPTGGYDVSVAGIEKTNIGQEGYSVDIYVEYKNPGPGQLVAQVVTYPHVIVKTDLMNVSRDTVFRFFIGDSLNTVRATELPE